MKTEISRDWLPKNMSLKTQTQISLLVLILIIPEIIMCEETSPVSGSGFGLKIMLYLLNIGMYLITFASILFTSMSLLDAGANLIMTLFFSEETGHEKITKIANTGLIIFLNISVCAIILYWLLGSKL